MPQSEEHAAVLDLLDVDRGVIALSRSDLVDGDTLEIAELEIDERTRGTSLEGWPIVKVSPVTGTGIGALRDALVAQLEAAGAPPDRGRPRLWVDRSFVISGAGVVVTGTLSGGKLHRGDTLNLLPGDHPVRIRSIQSHEREVEVAEPGTRTAINLAGADREVVARGMLLAAPGQARTTGRLLADVRTVRGFDDGLSEKGAFHLHVGTGVWPVRLRPVASDEIVDSSPVLLTVDTEVPVAVGDRFILREVGRRAVVAGGRVLETAPTGRLSHLAEHVTALREAVVGPPDVRAQALLEARGSARLADLFIDSGGGRPSEGIISNETATTEREAARLRDSMVRLADEFHEQNPLRAGVPRASLASQLDVEPELIDVLLRKEEQLVDEGATVRSAGFTGSLGPEEGAAWTQARELLADAGLAVPRASRLGLGRELLHALVRSGRLVRIAPDLVYLPEQVDEVLDRLGTLRDGFTVADFRDALGVSRRQAVPLLEWLDAEGRTLRRGDVRTIRKRPGRGGYDAPPP